MPLGIKQKVEQIIHVVNVFCSTFLNFFLFLLSLLGLLHLKFINFWNIYARNYRIQSSLICAL